MTSGIHVCLNHFNTNFDLTEKEKHAGNEYFQLISYKKHLQVVIQKIQIKFQGRFFLMQKAMLFQH